MGRLLPLLLGAISTLHILRVSAQAPACVETCSNETRNTRYNEMHCPDGAGPKSAPCFCPQAQFSNAILACSKACGGTPDNIFTYLSTNYCAGQQVARADSVASSSAPASQTATPSTPTTTSTTAAQTTPATTSASSTTATEAATTTTSTGSTASSSATAETTGSSTTSSTPSTTSGTAASATSSSAAAGGSSSSGLSQAAIAGIGVGIGAAVIAVAGIVICMLLKGRKRKPSRNGDNMDISKPLPGSGRMYPNREDNYRHARDHSVEKFGNDIEMTSHRYEDMVPRTQPRTMV